jgi:peptide/nickel transport system permease protein
MVSYIIRRTLGAIPLLFGITVISFLIIKMAPGDPSSLLLDPNISPADRERFMEKYGLNDPLPVQYVKWVGNMLQGDFGTSLIRKGVPVSEMIMNRLPNTLLLMVVSTIIAMLISIPFGVLSATRPYTK